MSQGVFLHNLNTGGKLYDTTAGGGFIANNKITTESRVKALAFAQANLFSEVASLGASDQNSARSNLGLAIGTNVQAYDAQLDTLAALSAAAVNNLTDIAALSHTDGGFIVSDGSDFTVESGATARASLGLAIGSQVQAYDAQLDDISGLTPGDGKFIVGDGSNFTVEDGATARASLGLTIGTNVQAYDDQLADIAALSLSDGDFLVGNGSGEIVAENGATVRTSLGLGTGDSPAFTSISLSGQAAALAMNSQKITGLADPTADQDAATKAYVDSTKAGLDVKESVRVASTAHIAASYNSSAKTLTASSAGVFSVDGVETALNDRILVKDQSTGSNNGIYTVSTAGAAGSGTGPNTSSAFTDGDYQYNSFVSTNISTTNFNTSAGFDASTTSLTWSSYSGASFQIDHRSIIVIKTGGGNVAYRMTADPAGFSFSGGSAATLPLDGKGLVASHSTTSAISIGAYISGIDVYEPKSAGPEFSLDDVLTGTLDQNTTSINIKTSSSPISYSGWEGGTLSAPFYIEVADSSSNKWYWKVTADVNNFDTSITVEFDEDDSHNATPSFNLGSDFGSAHSAGDIDFFDSGSGGSPVAAVLTRADDFDSSAKITAGAFTFVAEGTTNSDAGFVLSTNDAITLDSTALTFTQFSGAGQITAGTGLVKSGNTISATGGLADIAGLAKTDGGIIVGDGSNYVLETGATARASLGLTIGSHVQAYDAQLDTLSGFSAAQVTRGIANENLVTVDDADAADNDYCKFTATGIEGRSFAEVRSDLSLEVGTDVQAFDQQLADVAGLTPSDGAFIVGDGSNFTAESGATARASLALGKAAGRKMDITEEDLASGNASSVALSALNGMYIFDLSGANGARTFTLPSTAGAAVGTVVTVKLKDTIGSGASQVVAGNTTNQKIEGAASVSLVNDYASMSFVIREAFSSGSTECWVTL